MAEAKLNMSLDDIIKKQGPKEKPNKAISTTRPQKQAQPEVPVALNMSLDDIIKQRNQPGKQQKQPAGNAGYKNAVHQVKAGQIKKPPHNQASGKGAMKAAGDRSGAAPGKTVQNNRDTYAGGQRATFNNGSTGVKVSVVNAGAGKRHVSMISNQHAAPQLAAGRPAAFKPQQQQAKYQTQQHQGYRQQSQLQHKQKPQNFRAQQQQVTFQAAQRQPQQQYQQQYQQQAYQQQLQLSQQQNRFFQQQQQQRQQKVYQQQPQQQKKQQPYPQQQQYQQDWEEEEDEDEEEYADELRGKEEEEPMQQYRPQQQQQQQPRQQQHKQLARTAERGMGQASTYAYNPMAATARRKDPAPVIEELDDEDDDLPLEDVPYLTSRLNEETGTCTVKQRDEVIAVIKASGEITLLPHGAPRTKHVFDAINQVLHPVQYMITSNSDKISAGNWHLRHAYGTNSARLHDEHTIPARNNDADRALRIHTAIQTSDDPGAFLSRGAVSTSAMGRPSAHMQATLASTLAAANAGILPAAAGGSSGGGQTASAQRGLLGLSMLQQQQVALDSAGVSGRESSFMPMPLMASGGGLGGGMGGSGGLQYQPQLQQYQQQQQAGGGQQHLVMLTSNAVGHGKEGQARLSSQQRFTPY